MRNKLMSVLLMVACLMPLSAIENPDATFTIKAYKNDPGGSNPMTILSVYDALTETLNEVGQGGTKVGEIDVYPYLDKFLSDTPSVIKYPKNNVLFSFLVSGSGTGKYTLTIGFNNFTGPDGTTTDTINAYFGMWNVDVIFPSNHSKKAGDHNIALGKDANTKDAVSGAIKLAPTYNISWSVTPAKGKLSASWIAEGIVLMSIDNKQYNNASTGNYKATVTVTLAKN